MFKIKHAINLLMISIITCMSLVTWAANVDPTRPFGQSSAVVNKGLVSNQLVLQSIIHGDDIHTAVINSKIVKPGERIGQYRLVAINDDSVVLRSEDERLQLYVFKESIIK